MKLSLLEKYKPNNFEDLYIECYYIKLINLYLNNNKLLFFIHGNSCSGKTSLINIIVDKYYSKFINNNTTLQELKKNNIILFNILRDQGINYYRNDLKNFCQINNLNKKIKKTVIIDDLDLINDQSQQIFYYLINNYKNINFIFSSTNINKIDKNILDKLEMINLYNPTKDFIIQKLDFIINNENIVISEYNKNNIINSCNLNIPNMINLLEKILIYYNNNKCFTENIELDFLNILINDLHNYFELIKNLNMIESIKYMNKIVNMGYSVIDILDEMVNYIKFNCQFEDNIKYKIIKLLCNYINIFNNIHEEPIELIFLTNNLINIFNK